MSFSTLTYNILDVNLASNTILRTMCDLHKTELLKLVTTPNFKKIELIYITNFHSYTRTNLADKMIEYADKNIKRKLWGEIIDTTEDLNNFKSKFDNIDHIQFDDITKQLKISDIPVKNLRMLMIEYAANKNDAIELHKKILVFNTEIMDWNVRGLNIVKTLREKNADIVMLQEYGSCHEKPYTTGGKKLKDDLMESGYNYVFFLNKKFKKDAKTPEDGKEGVIIYYKNSKFKIATLNDIEIPRELIIDISTILPDYDYIRTFDIDETVLDTEIYVKNRKNEDYKDSSNKKIQLNTNFLVANKRAVGFVKLEILDTKQKVLAITSHLMTDAYDKHGLIKIEELKFVKNKLEELLLAEIIDPIKEGIVFGGDFNTKYSKSVNDSAYSDRDIFQSVYGCNFNGVMTISDSTDKKITLEDINKGSPTNIISSVNGTRKEWIDFIFFNNMTLKKTIVDYERLDESKTIPDKEHPSDHIPVMATFAFKLSGGYYEKYLKYKQKYMNLKFNNQ